MSMPNIFTAPVAEGVISRIEKLTPESTPAWGKMHVAQMLAHCCVTYDMIYTNKYPKPNGVARFLLKLFVKNTVVGENPYKKNSPTAPAFLIKDERNFYAEQKRLIDYIRRVQQEGEQAFDGKESNSFGKLTKDEWNTMFYKHLNHHLSQFNV